VCIITSVQAAFKSSSQRRSLRLAPNHAAQHADYAQDLCDAALVEHVHLDAVPDEFRGDVGLLALDSRLAPLP
jgi:hypothetical protein